MFSGVFDVYSLYFNPDICFNWNTSIMTVTLFEILGNGLKGRESLPLCLCPNSSRARATAISQGSPKEWDRQDESV